VVVFHRMRRNAVQNRTIDDLVRIAIARGGLVLNAGPRTTDDLVRIAIAAKGKGHVTLRGMAPRNTDDLVQIALAGGGHVTFEE
jgi:hypothetical protein